MGTFAASTFLALLAVQPSATGHTGIQTNPISVARMSAMDRELASDAFEGRAPGTAGEEKTIAWLIARLKGCGAPPPAATSS